MLRRHPQIYMPALKEPQFFAPEMRADPRFARELPSTLEEYLALFAGAAPGQRTGEASPSYLRSPRRRLRSPRSRPGARIIAVLREPAGFLRSLHLQMLQTMIETETDLRRAMALEPERRQGRTPAARRARRGAVHVLRARPLRRAAAPLPRGVPDRAGARADLRRLPRRQRGHARAVQRFLGVDDARPVEALEANPTSAHAVPRLHSGRTLLSIGPGPAARALQDSVKRGDYQLGCAGASCGRAPQLRRRSSSPSRRRPMRSSMRELRERFRARSPALSEYLRPRPRDAVGL